MRARYWIDQEGTLHRTRPHEGRFTADWFVDPIVGWITMDEVGANYPNLGGPYAYRGATAEEIAKRNHWMEISEGMVHRYPWRYILETATMEATQ